MKDFSYILMVKITKKTNPLNLLKDNSVSNNENIVSISQSLSKILMLVGVSGAVITMMICAIKYMIVSKTPEKLNEFKENVVFKFEMVILLFCFTFICGCVKAIVDMIIAGIG